MPPTGDLVFPLIASRRSRSLEIAGRTSRRRGSGDEIAGSRPYRRGDPIRQVDWAASARLSTAHGRDEFVVRDHFAEDAVRVVVVVDRAPSMSLYPDSLPWLHKPAAVREAVGMIVASTAAAAGLIGLADAGGKEARLDRPRRDPAARLAVESHVRTAAADGPPDSLDRALGLLLRHGAYAVPPGSFVFVLSDFLPAPVYDTLRAAVAAGWDVVPVIVQDPCWERSFPDVSGVTVPFAAPLDRSLALVRLSRREARERRRANEVRTATLESTLASLGLDAVMLTTDDRHAVHAAFLAWSDRCAESSRSAR
jgi:uncharacterized protein (DUF58 family)